MKVILTNSFHQTYAMCYPKYDGKAAYLTPPQVRSIRRKLCPGAPMCECGNFLGCRGKQEARFEETPDGGAVLVTNND